LKTTPDATGRDLPLLRALRGEKLARPPVWLMRQAGRYLPEYRAVREQAGGFLQMLHRSELAAEVTLQPVRRFGLDAAILFSDILVPLQAMGMELAFDEAGPRFRKPLRSRADIAALRRVEPAEAMAFVGEALGRVREQLPRGVALLGFAGAPFTLASYAIEGGTSRSFLELRKMMHRAGTDYELLVDRLAEVVGAHLRYQVECGADAVMLFDTWAGTLGREDYARFAFGPAQAVVSQLKGICPCIVYVESGGHLLDELASLGAQALSIDHRIPIGAALERFRGRLAVQGNLDPAALLATPEEVASRTRALLAEVAGRPGHVLNLGHGVLKTTDPECVAAFVESARNHAPSR
jgi:uroporphyrinogen decarboxylase